MSLAVDSIHRVFDKARFTWDGMDVFSSVAFWHDRSEGLNEIHLLHFRCVLHCHHRGVLSLGVIEEIRDMSRCLIEHVIIVM